MPAIIKPLFRPEALRPKLAAFQPAPASTAGRGKLADWVRLLASPKAAKMKETELLPEFIGDLFGGLLEYKGPAGRSADYTLKREPVVEVDGKFADAALGRFSTADGPSHVAVVVEGKGPTDPLDRPFKNRRKSAVDQALGYAVNLPCDWYLVTNLNELRLYHKGHDQFTYERFETKAVAEQDDAFRRFAFLLGAPRVVLADGSCHLDGLLSDSQRIGRKLTNEFYREYRWLRERTFQAIRDANPEHDAGKLLAATQKILDRVLFIAFCEDRELLPREIIDRAYRHSDAFNPRPIWQNFVSLFRFVDKGNDALEIWRYNGGLFARDEFLEGLTVPDNVCEGFKKLAEYEYGNRSEGDGKLIDVEILGHIFEQSITDLEELHRSLAAGPDDEPETSEPSKRKKEGAFYTPSFVTRYIVAETLGPVLRERFERLRAEHEAAAAKTVAKVLADPAVFDADTLTKPQTKALVEFWEAWLTALESVRILDPACGSGAFLIEAFDQMFAEYTKAQGFLKELDGPTIFGGNRTVLTNNLFGLDLNSEAVEIARLSCWIKTAEYGKELTTLDENIEQGNSVVDPTGNRSPLEMWQERFRAVFKAGGFDVVIGNPPYVRQEWIKEDKPYLEQHYRAFHGVADLYVYFYELGLSVLKPGGRLGFVVTNKWMKAGYGEPLRGLFGESAWVEQVIDFGHAKQIFPDADVFPSILVFRKPTKEPAPDTARVCIIPREQLRIDDLSRQAHAEGIPVPLTRFGPAAWNLEPAGVTTLLQKLQRGGPPLKEFAGIKPLYGIKTGYNEAFLIDEAVKKELIQKDPNAARVIKPYLRGQDISRWSPEWASLWMIFARKGFEIDRYPSIKSHLEQYRTGLEPKPKDWKGDIWPGRKPGSYLWFELQDPVDYWQAFDKPKTCIQRIAFHSRIAIDRSGMYLNDSAIILPTTDPWLLAVLNSPPVWYLEFRTFPHKKDEALAMDIPYVENLPIPRPSDSSRAIVEQSVDRLVTVSDEQHSGRRAVLDWLRLEFGIEKPSQKLQALTALNADGLIGEVKKLRGKKKLLTVADMKRLKDEHATSIVPLQTLEREADGLERQVSDIVNEAFGLTPEDVRLMWDTAPPRMPFSRTG
jgi:type I restriction-modification system DNA methylase subunit